MWDRAEKNRKLAENNLETVRKKEETGRKMWKRAEKKQETGKKYVEMGRKNEDKVGKS